MVRMVFFFFLFFDCVPRSFLHISLIKIQGTLRFLPIFTAVYIYLYVSIYSTQEYLSKRWRFCYPGKLETTYRQVALMTSVLVHPG
jgi:hypothetical protein